MAKTKKKNIVNYITLTIVIIYAILSMYTLCKVISLGIIPTKYLVVLIIIYAITLLIGFKVALAKKLKKWVKVVIDLLTLCSIGLIMFILNYLGITLGVMKDIKAKDYQLEEYYLVVEKQSKYNKLEDLKLKKIATYANNLENYTKALAEIEDTISVDVIKEKDVNKAAEDLLAKKVDSLLVSSIYYETLKEEVENFSVNTKIVKKFKFKVKKIETKKEVDVKNESFNIFISGVDVYGNIANVSRSDVNMIATVNPKTNKVLLTSVPRDYYVQLHGTKGNKDKLTHAGIYGVDMSLQTMEDLFGIDINYYIRVNFTTLISVVDAIGGVDIYNDFAFKPTYHDVYFRQGNVHLNGENALIYARERKVFLDGDVQRVKNQQKVLTAIINKITSSKTLITKYKDIMGTMSNSFETNMDDNKFYDLINLQINKMPSWAIESCNVTGYDASKYTYSYPGQLLYVMEPNQETVEEVKAKIKSTFGN